MPEKEDIVGNTESPSSHPISYTEYYTRVLKPQISDDIISGLKLVAGPTGMGKTRAIPDAINVLREQGFEKRFIYTSNRHLLIEEMEVLLSEANIPSVYLKRDETLVCNFLKNKGKAAFLEQLNGHGFFAKAGTSLHETRKLLEKVHTHVQVLEKFPSQLLNSPAYQELEKQLNSKCRDFLTIFKNGLRNIAKSTPELHEQLCQQNSLLWHLFPYIQFLYDPTEPVLLVTIHKLLYGFFDGRKNEKLLALENNVIFFDEFDMQEKELLTFLCRSPEIQNSFEFVRLFYEEMREQQTLGYLAVDDIETQKRKDAKENAAAILEKLENDFQAGSFGKPEFKRFVLKEGDFKSDRLSVFQSSVQILTNPFYLLDQKHKRCWKIVKKPTRRTLESRRLFQIIFNTTEAILEFFSELWADQLVDEWENWIEQCYDRKNDYAAGKYKEIISSYGLFKRPTKISKEQQIPKEVKESIYYTGYNFFRLLKGVYQTAHDEVKVEQRKLTVSPEYILWRLCQSNFIFALSATGDIKRYINSFDMNWLEQHCNYVPIDAEDKKFVAALKQHKEQQRNYDIRFAVANVIQNRSIIDAIELLHKDNFFKNDNEEGPGDQSGSRRNGLKLVLETLRWITMESHNQGHLLFLNSFRFLEKLCKKPSEVHQSLYDTLQSHLSIEPIPYRDREYRVAIEGHACHVIFFDAAKGRTTDDKCFVAGDEKLPLVVVTTYNTASNGVNLRWLKADADSGSAGDFEGIHLLEAHHFYFEPEHPYGEDDVDKKKKFLWQMWKLFWNHEISEQQFRGALQHLPISRMNMEYKDTRDYLLNQIALFYQALGRVDRQWKRMPVMDIRLSHDVITIFDQYLTAEGVIAKERIEREAYTSSLILQLHQELETHFLRKKILNELQNESIQQLEERNKAIIEKLLNMSQKARDGYYSQENAKKVMWLWWKIREAMLKQDYQFRAEIELTINPVTDEKEVFSVDFQSDFVHQTAFLHNSEEVYIDRRQQTIHPYQMPDTSVLNLNWPYRQLEQHETIKWYFKGHNYKLRYHPSNQNNLFTPHALQAVLAGAIGEAALQALLKNAFSLQLESEYDCPPELFEVFDMKLQGIPVYVDAKNYGWSTLSRFAATPGQPEFDDKLNSRNFLQAAQKKWKYIVDKTGDARAKLVFVNLIAAGEHHPVEGWNRQLKKIEPYSYVESDIIIIQGALRYETTTNTYSICNDLITWIHDLKEWNLKGA